MRVAQKLLIGLIISVLMTLVQKSYAQIDSRNQERPAKQQATNPKKTKKVKKTKKARKQASGKKFYSNKEQIRNSKKSFKKGGEKAYKGDVTGRKIKKTRTTPRKTKAYPQPNPYAGRQIRTEAQRAGPPPRKIKTATKKGEVARTGDISGRRRIRQRSVSTNPKPIHRQPNTYGGRKMRTEKDRAYSNRKQIQNIRSVSKPSETRKRKTTTRIVTATAPHIVKRKKNVYRNHEQRKGEQASTRDIAGKKIRTKNFKSEQPSRGRRAMANPKVRTDKTKSGDRFKKPKYQTSGVRSVSRSSERSGGGAPMANQRIMKNFKSQRAKSVVQPKPIRTYGNRKKGNGEAAIFGAYSAKKIRSVTKKSESKAGKRKPTAPSISGTGVFAYKKVHPYRGKDRRFSGEHSSTKDIAGKKLRTKNFRSRRPNYGSIGSMNYRSASASPSNKSYNKNNSSSISRRWNNNSNPLIRKDGDSGVGRFAGTIKYHKPAKGGGSISRKWNNNGNPLMQKDRGEGIAKATTYRGNIYPRGMDKPNIGFYQGEIKSKGKQPKGYPTQKFIGNVRIESKRPSKLQGGDYGKVTKIAGIKFGTSAGLMQPSTIKKNKTDTNVITARIKERKKASSQGTTLGKKTTLSFITIGNPNFGGLVYERKRLKINNKLPDNLNRHQKRRVKAAPGMLRGTDWALSFWEFGNPSQMGFKKQHTKAKGNMHPSASFSHNSHNSVAEKEKLISFRLMWAKIFKKNSATPKPDKEYSHKLKYDKDERSIWETEEREDWYNN